MPIEILNKEQDAVGFYLSGHPLDEYGELLTHLRVETYHDFCARVEKLKRENEERKAAEPDNRCRAQQCRFIAGRAGRAQSQERSGARQRTILFPSGEASAAPIQASPVRWRVLLIICRSAGRKKGNKFAFAAFSDAKAQFEMVMFSETLEATRELLQPGEVVLLKVSADPESEGLRLRLLSAEPLDQAAGRLQKGVQLTINKETAFPEIAERLAIGGNGRLRLVLRLENMDKDVVISIERGLDTSPRQASALRVLPGVCDMKDI